MTKKIAIAFLAVAFSAGGAFAAEEKSCWDRSPFPEPPNPIIGLLTVPAKMAYVMTLPFYCGVQNIPKNEEKQ